ncbi:SIN1-domain-containing protein [Sistotremastrum suecicum HHB10207 ss-3]|uniref:SIN1-domain-containing protein n=1 Tax=Sistotremastrum suecicum HHB10207 ss-3 TaxID=1314776 RepID=A0A166AGM4_9AGAM|nr:SIN1-domain-containing protein [Sistotremastrum suecicum HHB10207 ss-3]
MAQPQPSRTARRSVPTAKPGDRPRMSLISDPDYFIHTIRLAYLRHVDNPYGPRINTLNPRYKSNAYITASGLADPEKWPELNIPTTPVPDDDEGNESSRRNSYTGSGWPGATGLKYTQTIMGKRTGGLGYRVSGRRTAHTRESSLGRQGDAGRRIRSDSEPTPVVGTSAPTNTGDEGVAAANKRRSVGASSLTEALETNQVPIMQAPPAPEAFKPPFARADEMEARRRARMRARARTAPVTGAAPAPMPLESDSSDESDQEEDSDFPADQDEDEFETDFVPRITASSASDEMSMMSGISASTSAFNSGTASFQAPAASRTRSRLSPVSEVRVSKRADQSPSRRRRDALYFANTSTTSDGSQVETPPIVTTRPRAYTDIRPPPVPELTFNRITPKPVVHKSLLSEMISAQGSPSDNPFSELYSAIAGRQDAFPITVFFPHSSKPDQAMDLNVRKDATVEEVIGFALWSYWDEGRLPSLEDGAGRSEEERKVRLSAVGWSLRIAEDDGEVDEDFPPLDRAKRISTFNLDAYAVVPETSPSQIAKNKEDEAKLVRRPSRIRIAKRKNENLAPSNVADVASSAMTGGTSIGLPSMMPSSSHGPPIFLRIKVAETMDVVHYRTTVQVFANMYMAEALDMVCRRRKLDNPKEWALILDKPPALIFLDRTVASLQGKNELILVKRNMLGNYGFSEKRNNRSTDPNASIFKRNSEVPEQAGLADFTAYKKFNVSRKLPMLGHHDRILAIDGDYIHIMPSGSKVGFLDSAKTASYHVKSLINCVQSGKTAAFKLVVLRDGANKRYDFEAENTRAAEDIVQCITNLQKSYKKERSGTIRGRGSRRSRHVT